MATLLLGLAGCMRVVPSHLSVEPPTTTRTADWSTPQGAIRTLIDGDALVRRPRFPDDPATLRMLGFPGMSDTVEGLRKLEASGGQLSYGLQQLDDAARGTEGLPLVRGYRLMLAERRLGLGADDIIAWSELAVLLTPLRPPRAVMANGTNPLSFLGQGPSFADATRRSAERWCLMSWLQGPGVDLAPVAEVLATPLFDGLRARPLGRLVSARGRAQAGDPTSGLVDLGLATTLALQWASADRDAEQAAWAERRKALGAELGTDDPIGFLLRRALPTLTAASAAPEATGAALLAHEALRWLDRCEDPPCRGLDRTSGMHDVVSWSPSLEPLSRTWRVIALKEATDAFEVGHDSIRLHVVTVDLVDALIGTGCSAPDTTIIGRATSDPGLWNQLGTMLGRDQATTWEEVRVALGEHLAAEAREARSTVDPATAEVLDRIARRAVP